MDQDSILRSYEDRREERYAAMLPLSWCKRLSGCRMELEYYQKEVRRRPSTGLCYIPKLAQRHCCLQRELGDRAPSHHSPALACPLVAWCSPDPRGLLRFLVVPYSKFIDDAFGGFLAQAVVGQSSLASNSVTMLLVSLRWRSREVVIALCQLLVCHCFELSKQLILNQIVAAGRICDVWM